MKPFQPTEVRGFSKYAHHEHQRLAHLVGQARSRPA
jgi:hypothetical protein